MRHGTSAFGEAQPSDAWPGLISRNGEPTPGGRRRHLATAAGSHAEELERWTELALTRPAARRR